MYRLLNINIMKVKFTCNYYLVGYETLKPITKCSWLQHTKQVTQQEQNDNALKQDGYMVYFWMSVVTPRYIAFFCLLSVATLAVHKLLKK